MCTDPRKEKSSDALPRWGQGAELTRDSFPGGVTGGLLRNVLHSPGRDDITFPNCRVGYSVWTSDHSGVTHHQWGFSVAVIWWLSNHCDTSGTQGWWHLLFSYRLWDHEDSHLDLTEGRTPHSESPDLGLNPEVDGFGPSSFGQKWMSWCLVV